MHLAAHSSIQAGNTFLKPVTNAEAAPGPSGPGGLLILPTIGWEHDKKQAQTPPRSSSPAALPVPGYPAYTVTAEGVVFFNGRPKKLHRKRGRAPQLLVRHNGLRRCLGVAKLVATLFVPNPQEHTKLIFIDGNNRHCTAGNIRWVSNREYARHTMLKEDAQERRRRVYPARRKAPAVRPLLPCPDKEALPLPGFEGYYITPSAKVYRGASLLKPHTSGGNKAPQLRLKYAGTTRYLGLAKLVATAFLPNPRGYTRIIFKDRNNQNCLLSNLAWVSGWEYRSYSASFSAAAQQATVAERHPDATPIPGFNGYFITPDGVVYNGNRLLRPYGGGGRSLRVKLRNRAGVLVRVALPKLIALTFVPNPEGHPKIIFKDRNPANCTAENIAWVSFSQFASFVQSGDDLEDVRQGAPNKGKRQPDWIDPERVEIIGLPGYFISPGGRVYRGDRIIRPQDKKGQSLKVRLRPAVNPPGQYLYLGLAKLLAEHFVPNPRRHKHVIFKDRNNRNCVAANIAWVDGETFAFYSGITKGAAKRQGNREEAIKTCTDIYLREYYKTGDESWLHECWAAMEKKVTLVPDWNEVRADCYIYFLDRARRYTLLKDPAGLMVVHARGVRKKIREEISPDMTLAKVRAVVESLRNTRRSRRDTYYEAWQ